MDECLSIFTMAQKVWQMPFRPADRVLEIGSAEADWVSVALAIEPTLKITALDQREATRKGAQCVQCDLFDWTTDQRFDWLVFISTLEHIGLGHYGDKKVPDGDGAGMNRATAWLRLGGLVYADVPWHPLRGWVDHDQGYRVYTQPILRDLERACGLVLRSQGWWVDRRFTEDFPERPLPNPKDWWYTACLWEYVGRANA